MTALHFQDQIFWAIQNCHGFGLRRGRNYLDREIFDVTVTSL